MATATHCVEQQQQQYSHCGPCCSIIVSMAAAAKPSLVKLFVARLPWITCHESLKSHFKQFGAIKDARVVFDLHTGRSKKYGFVVYKNKISADKALSYGPHIVDGKEIAVLLSDVPAKDKDLDSDSE